MGGVRSGLPAPLISFFYRAGEIFLLSSLALLRQSA